MLAAKIPAPVVASVLVFLALHAGRDAAAVEPTARVILDRALERAQIGLVDGEALVAMAIHDGRGNLIERTMRARTRTQDGARRTRITFTEPADQRGVELLMIEARGGETTQYLYLPRLARRQRIASAAKRGRFEGSDFSFADLERRSADGGAVSRLPDATYAKQPVRRVVVTARDGEDAEDYRRVELWIGKESGVVLKIRFFDRDDAPVKELRVKRLSRVEGGYVPTRMEMRSLREGSRTVLEVVALDPTATFAASVFEPESLGR